MPYLRPETILRRFSQFTRQEVRTAITTDENGFMEAQVGSMSSTMRFLSMELDGIRDAVTEQHEALEEALNNADAVLTGNDPPVNVVRKELETANNRLATAPRTDVYAHEQELLDISQDILAVIDTELEEDVAREVRRPLYEFLSTRVSTQLKMLGREEP